MSYDSWLAAPYEARANDSAAWEAFCDANDYEYEVEDKETEFEEWVEGRNEPDPDDARDAWLESRWED